MKQSMRLIMIIIVALLIILVSIFARITGNAVYAEYKSNITSLDSDNTNVDSTMNNVVIINNATSNQTGFMNQTINKSK